MKQIFSILYVSFFISTILITNAQVVFKDYNAAALQAMIKGRTYAVLTNDTTFNKWFQHSLDQVWSVSTLTYITAAQLDTAVKSDKNVFLFAQARDKSGGAVHLLNSEDIAGKKDFLMMLSQGGAKQAKYLFTPATSGPKIIAYFRYSPERADVTAGMLEGEMLLAFMNQSLQIIVDNKIKGGVHDSIWYRISYEAPQIKDKTMLFNKAYSDGTIALEKKVLLNDKIVEGYSFDYRQTTSDTIKDILENNPANYVYLFLYYPSSYVNQADDSGDILVYDPSQKKMLYYDDNLSGPWVEKGEFKDIEYAIKQK